MAEKLAIPLDDIDAIVAWHNVAGQDGVLTAASDTLAEYINSHYSLRAIDHLPHLNGRSLPCFALSPDADAFTPQAQYRQQLSDCPVSPLASLHALPARGIQRPLLLPYIRLNDPAIGRLDPFFYGLPPDISLKLKDKVFLHNWLMNNSMAAYILNFVTCPLNNLVEQGQKMIRQILGMYDNLDVRGKYPAGLMIRGQLSDGNYGCGTVIEAITTATIAGQMVKPGQVIFKPDGKTDRAQIFKSWKDALTAAYQHILDNTNTDIAPDVILTRLIDLQVSPGMCAIVADSQFYGCEFNGQFMAPGHSACTGTWTFKAAVGEQLARVTGEHYLGKSQDLLKNILYSFLETIPGIYAMLNMDIMLPGDMEIALWQKARTSPHHSRWINNRGLCNEQYQPAVYGSENVLLSEINPRDTNWTLAVKAVLQAQKRPPTINNLVNAISGNDLLILARDHWHLPPGCTVSEGRDRLAEFHRQLSKNGEGIILRMPDNPAGIIVYTPSADVKRIHEIEQEAYHFLQK